MKYAYFPGCSLEGTSHEFDTSARAVCRALGIELTDIPDWVCCGSTPAHSSNQSLAIALPAMNLKKAEAMQMPVMTACASCYARLRTANHEILASEDERKRAARITKDDYDGNVPVHHILDALVNHFGIEQIQKKIKKSLGGLRVASYYGCLLSRPPKVVAFDDPEHPSCMDEIVECAGGTPVDWPLKTECCGASLSISNTSVVCRLSHRILSMLNKVKADCCVVACPLCQVNLDMRQADAMAGMMSRGEI